MIDTDFSGSIDESYLASLGSSLSGGGTPKNSGIEPSITARTEELLKEDGKSWFLHVVAEHMSLAILLAAGLIY